MKRKKSNQLQYSYDSLEEKETIITVEVIRERILDLMKRHIGRYSAISVKKFFEIVMAIPYAEHMDVYQRMYWWTVIKRVMYQLKSEEKCFIINTKFALYVLQTSEEANKYKDECDRRIKNIKNNKFLADKWVSEEKWKEL